MTWKNIVVGIDLADTGRPVASPDDLSRTCRIALDTALWLSRRYDASLHVLTALDVDSRGEELILDAHRFERDSVIDRAARALDSLVGARRRQGVRVSTAVTLGRPGVALLADVRRNERDLVVVGPGERGALARYAMGGTALHLLRFCPVPLWVARREPESGIRTVVAASVLDEASPEVVRSAATLAREVSAELRVLHAIDDLSERVLRAVELDERALELYRRRRQTDADVAAARFAAEAATIGCSVTTRLCEGPPARVIVEDARAVDAEAIVIGLSPHDGCEASACTTIAEKVLAEIDSSLLVVRPCPILA